MKKRARIIDGLSYSSLGDAKKIIDELIEECGEDAYMDIDARFVELSWYSLETEDEAARRIADERESEERRREHDLIELRRLKEKYEGQ